MFSHKEISDRLELQDLCYRYSEIIDNRDFDALRSDVFTHDAYIDYSATGGGAGNLDDTIAFLKDAAAKQVLCTYYHLNANFQFKFDGDSATSKVMCLNPIGFEANPGIFMSGFWYLDEYIRTTGGWRISRRSQQAAWTFDSSKQARC